MAQKFKDYKCRRCGCDLFYMEELKTLKDVAGLYCDYCGAWYKWLNKDEKRLFKKGR